MRKVVILQYGPIEYDGRTLRVAEIASEQLDTIVVDCSDKEYQGRQASWKMKRVIIRRGKFWPHIKLMMCGMLVAWKERPDYIIAENYFTLPAAWAIHKVLNLSVLYDAHELNIKERRVGQSFRDKCWYLSEALLIGCAKVVVAANEERARIMKKIHKLHGMPYSFLNIPNPKRRECVPDMDEVQQLLKLKRRGFRLLLYQGDMCLERGLGRFIEAMSYIKKEFKLILIGDGPDLDAIKIMAQAKDLNDRIVFVGKVESHRLCNLTQLCHVGIVTYSHLGLNNYYCSPNKIFEYAMSGLPVIATNQLPLKRMLTRTPIGSIVASNMSSREIASVMKKTYDNREAYMSEIPRFLEEHNYEKEKSRFRLALESMA